MESGSPVTIGGLSAKSKEFSWTLGTGTDSIVATYAERALDGSYSITGADNKSVVFNGKETAGATLFQFKGIGNTSAITVDDKAKVVSLTASSFADNVVAQSVRSGYKIALRAGDYKDKSFTGTANADTIQNVGNNISINGGGGADYITSSGANVTLSGGKGNDTLVASKGNSTLNGGTGNDVLTGGDGKNTFVISEGSDTINNYDYEKDVITGAALPTSFDSIFASGKDLVFAFKANSSVTFKNSKAVTLASGDDTYVYTENTIAKNDNISLGAKYTSKNYDGRELNYTAIDGSRVTVSGGLTIRGNDKASALIGAKSGGEIYGS